ncbi:hypothetical protein ILUMI_16974 [Ignelater luminosus]|uniref:Uncharacterized protein n=1 Tax=Ignelater luminosus TaxID=2038154 RepID=A0A8K0G7Q1_IGNLU|nr:hypothetical protein ILUMI_16974 [Ignelater luminosus]
MAKYSFTSARIFNADERQALPIKTTSRKVVRANRKKQHADIFVSTPNKDELEKKENKKQEQQTRIKVRNYQKASKMAKTVSRETDDVCSSDEKSEAEVNKEVYLVCDKFGKNEIWLRCTLYGQWAHKACTNAISAPSNCG